MSFYKKLRDDTSMIQLTVKNPRWYAVWNEKLNKYAVSFQTYIKTPRIKKKLGFKDLAFFSIIVDVEEEIFLNVFSKKIDKVWLCCDSSELVCYGDSFSMFWRNQREPSRECRIYTATGDKLQFTKRGYRYVAAINENWEEGV